MCYAYSLELYIIILVYPSREFERNVCMKFAP